MDQIAVEDSRLNRVLVQAKKAPSVSRADELIKSGAVRVGDESISSPAFRLASGNHILHVGKQPPVMVVIQ